MLFVKACKACSCKDHTIKVLEEQNTFLRDLLVPKSIPSLAQLEAEAVFSDNQEAVTITDFKDYDQPPSASYKEYAAKAKGENAAEEELLERDLILGGNY